MKPSTGASLALGVLCAAAHGQITVPGADGSDGVFAPTENTVVDLSLAANRPWDEAGPVPGNGVYDKDKWAVVFKYESVDIPAGVTVSFKNHPSNAPLVWLVSGDVTISGTLSVRGSDGHAGGHTPTLASPGPGGFRGGRGGRLAWWVPAAGFGPGGARSHCTGWRFTGAGGGHATDGGTTEFTCIPGGTYGNAAVVPLLGGSGGAGGASYPTQALPNQAGSGGGAGGGALLIACQGRIQVDGRINANGGNGNHSAPGYSGGGGGGGAGGAVRVIANSIAGGGSLTALGGNSVHTAAGVGGHGRIRIETTDAQDFDPVAQCDPQASLDFPGDPAVLWPPSDTPFVRIVSVNGLSVPTDPRAQFAFPHTDVSIMTDEEVSIIMEAQNVPLASTVELRIIPGSGPDQRIAANCISGDDPCSTWEVTTALPVLFSALQVLVELP